MAPEAMQSAPVAIRHPISPFLAQFFAHQDC
jgi:hypothetical protein